MRITSGKIDSAIKTVIYGPEGIGKSTLAAQFPRPVFIDTEGSTTHMDVRRTPRPQSWAELLSTVKWIVDHPAEAGTLVIDTADWAEILCTETVCARAQKSGIEEFGYGKGYTYLAEEFGRLIILLDLAKDRGINVVVTAHAKMRKFEQPDEMGAYDRWEMKLSKQVAPLIKEWADMVLFACYKTYVINVDGQGAQKGRNKAQGGERILRTTHNPCWDAKNRFGLPDEMPMRYDGIAHLLRDRTAQGGADVPAVAPGAENVAADPASVPGAEGVADVSASVPGAAVPTTAPGAEATAPQPSAPERPETYADRVPERVARLMRESDVTPEEVVYVVAQKGYFPADMPFGDYPKDFIDGWMLPFWPQIVEMIRQNREDVPF